MKAAFAATIVLLLLAIACGDGSAKPEAAEEEEAIEITTGAGEVGVATAGAATALPGITVLGTAEGKAKPDGAIIRLTIGTGSEFFAGPGGPRFELIEEEELEPVVEALKEAGAAEADIVVNTFSGALYGPFPGGNAQITVTWPRPQDVEDILEAAQDAVRKHTDYGLQNVETLFTLKDCERVEEKAWRAALDNARQRAQRLAQLAGASLGDIVAISEVSGFSPFGPSGLTGCQALRSLPPPFFGPPLAALNSPSQVAVAVALQVTFAIE